MMRYEVATKASPATPARDSVAPLESVLRTEELHRRPSRPPDYEADSRAMGMLAVAMVESPRNILQTLAEKLLEVFKAGSAGISLLTPDEKRFFWPAIAGVWKAHIGGGTPRDFGPCGDVLDRNAPQLFGRVDRRYTYFQPVAPPVEECLLVPFYVHGRAVGTIWVISHNDRRTFDLEDLRQLENLACFASAAYEAQNQSKRADESRRAALNLLEDAVEARQAMEEVNARLRESSTRLQLARDAASLGILDLNPLTRELWWDDRSRELWGLEPGDPATIASFWAGVHAGDVAEVRAQLERALAGESGESWSAEFRLRPRESGPERWVCADGTVSFMGDGPQRRAKRLIIGVQDVSARKAWDGHQRLLLAELSHRVKNTLAVVLSIARQTVHGGNGRKPSLEGFEGRLLALSQAHDLLIEGDWKSAELGALARRQIAEPERVDIEGPKVALPADLATPFALLIHELCTNAAKHGSLSKPDGRVSLTWRVEPKDGRQLLKLQWRERDGPRIEKPKSTGFGNLLIEKGIPGAKVVREYLRDGFVCTVELSLRTAAPAA